MSLVRVTAVGVLGVVAMTATAHLAAPPARPMSPQADRAAAAEPVRVSSVRITTGRNGVAVVDVPRVRTLAVGDTVDLSPLKGAETEAFRVDRREVDGIGSTWWLLNSVEFEESQAVLVERRGFVSVWMQSPKFGDAMEWQFVPVAPGRVVPSPRALDLPGCGGSVDPGMGPEPPADHARMSGIDEDECAGCGSVYADVAFFYTPQVLERVQSDLEDAGGDPEDAEDIIAVRCAQESANTTSAMDNSGLAFGTRLIHVSMLEDDESGGDLLGLFTGTDDGVWDEVHEIRDEIQADACSLVALDTDNDPETGLEYCGVANLVNGNNPAGAFNVLIWGCFGALIHAHEFGHNLGCCHAKGDGGGCDDETECVLWEPTWAGCCSPDPTGPKTEFASFNHGWRWVNTLAVPACVRTVMAYAKTEGTGSLRIPNYSNPDISYLGTPTGRAEDDPDQFWADNASVIRANMPPTTRYRCEPAAVASESGRLVAGGLGSADFFGFSLATNGLTLAAGANRSDVIAENAGATFLFANPVEESEDDPDLGWIQTGVLTPSALAETDRFGESVAMDGDVLVVGAAYTARQVIDDATGDVIEDHPLAGAAWVWIDTEGNGNYCQMERIQPDELLDYDTFGASVAVAGDLVAIGAPFRDLDDGGLENAGSVWVYRRVGDAYEQIAVLEGDQVNGRFGASLAASVQPNGNVMLLVGAPRELFDYGQVHPYRFVNIGDGWAYESGTPVFAPWPGGRFGTAVAMRGEDVIIGAPMALEERGAARVYRVDGEQLQDRGVLENANAPGDRSGASVAISETYAAVGVPGYDVTVVIEDIETMLDNVGLVAVYNRELGDVDWTIRQVQRPSDLRPGDAFGSSVAVAGNRLFAGAPEADDSGVLSGAVYAIDISQIVDCNGNGVDDSLDIFTGTSVDHDGDGIPDECAEGDCDADINGDGVVDGADLGLFFVAWGPCPGDEIGCPGDISDDGVVSGIDLGLFCASWGLECPPDKPEP